MIQHRFFLGFSLAAAFALAGTPQISWAHDQATGEQSAESSQTKQSKEDRKTDQLLQQMALTDGYSPQDRTLLDVHPEKQKIHTYSQNAQMMRNQQAGSASLSDDNSDAGNRGGC